MATDEDELTGITIGSSIEVHRHVRPGSFEAVDEECLVWELRQRGLRVRRQVAIPLVYKGVRFDIAYRADMIVDDRVIVEVKSIERVLPVHESQIITYLALSGLRVGLLLNFNVPLMRDGIRRFVL